MKCTIPMVGNMTEKQTASIYDFLNAKPKTLTAALRNQKQINQFLLTDLEKKNKVIRQMQQDIETLKGNYLHTNKRIEGLEAHAPYKVKS